MMSVERKRQSYKDGSSRSFFIKQNNDIVSSASTAAENSKSAMVVSVATDSNHQKKGYAKTCMRALCATLIDEGKELCLFYDNPVAGALYHSIGFEDIGKWMMYTYV